MRMPEQKSAEMKAAEEEFKRLLQENAPISAVSNWFRRHRMCGYSNLGSMLSYWKFEGSVDSVSTAVSAQPAMGFRAAIQTAVKGKV
jgi:hypothetical protein